MEEQPKVPVQVPGDLYNRIFAIQATQPELMVEYSVWNQIFANLPRDYQLPDLQVLERTRP
ncbi:hypothetical protein DFP94_104238 [Fontibacillus phaseoli]|uniref:Uncharacterized protein n=1 Tax=Fontibacillus phaseoli TaxID=1416533 RepID=A0A369BE06_9BACL|nr:hypothetical protein [Fontibacillus phaseoli]RCX19783.1 hypothetical protein DFP94_104238 [Fontibacillus phaseoli]